MADITISGLNPGSPAGTDVIPYSNGTNTLKVQVQSLPVAWNSITGRPSIPSAQVNSDWNASSGVAQILNKPIIPTVNSLQLAKAWVCFNGEGGVGTNQSIYSSYNISSVYKNSEGWYTINFLSGVFANGNYCCTGAISMPNGCATSLQLNTNSSFGAVTPTATSMSVLTHCSAQGNRSPAYVSLVYYT